MLMVLWIRVRIVLIEMSAQMIVVLCVPIRSFSRLARTAIEMVRVLLYVIGVMNSSIPIRDGIRNVYSLLSCSIFMCFGMLLSIRW